jgi:nucleoside phosphorylase
VDSVTLIPPGSEFEGLDFENMECFGLAWVAHKKNISFTAILAITNDVGPLGSDQWRANYRAYSRELQKRILNGLTSPDL